jgi:hypothetical protein
MRTLTARTPSVPAKVNIRVAPQAHDDAEAQVGLCDCNRRLDERRRRMTDSLLAAALSALYDAGDLLHLIRRSHCARPDDCQLCNDAKMTWRVLGQVKTSLEGEYRWSADPDLARRRAKSERDRSAPARRRRWRPDGEGNFPPLPLTVLLMIGLQDVLEALRDGHGCGLPDCYTCDQAATAAFLLPMLTAALETTMRPCLTILRRRGVSVGYDPVLRLLEASRS